MTSAAFTGRSGADSLDLWRVVKPHVPQIKREDGVATVSDSIVEFALLLIKQVFTNEDGSTGIQYLVTSNTALEGNNRRNPSKTRERGTLS